MTGFKRVRDVHTKAEYHVPVTAIEKWPEDYEVIDDTVVTEPQPGIPGPAPKAPRQPATKAAAAKSPRPAAAKKTPTPKPKPEPAKESTEPTTQPPEGVQK